MIARNLTVGEVIEALDDRDGDFNYRVMFFTEIGIDRERNMPILRTTTLEHPKITRHGSNSVTFSTSQENFSTPNNTVTINYPPIVHGQVERAWENVYIMIDPPVQPGGRSRDKSGGKRCSTHRMSKRKITKKNRKSIRSRYR